MSRSVSSLQSAHRAGGYVHHSTCCEPFAGRAGVLGSVAHTINGSLSQPVEKAHADPLCFRNNTDPPGFPMGNVCFILCLCNRSKGVNYTKDLLGQNI